MHALTFKPSTERPGEFPAVAPKVWINGKEKPYFTCLAIEENSGVTPSKAILSLRPELIPDNLAGREASSPNTLNVLEELQPNFGARVAITINNTLMFAGHMLRREDNGALDSITWTALDDREMLSKIPIRGAVVADEYKTGSVYKAKFLSRFNAVCNPNGLWNCIGHTVAIAGHPLNGVVVPVFSARAHLRQNYESPDAVFPEKLKDNELTAWTPRRLLQYIWFVLHIGVQKDGDTETPDIQGLQRSSWRSIRNYPRGTDIGGSLGGAGAESWDWDYETIDAMVGKEPKNENDAASTDTIDPLDRKLATINLQGIAALQAIDDVLTAAGTHTYSVVSTPEKEEDEDSKKTVWTGFFKSSIKFFPVGYTAVTSEKTTQSQIPLLRSGKPSMLDNANTAYDFQLAEDATFSKSSVFVEGDVVRVETQVTSGNGLLPAWGRPTDSGIPAGYISEEEAFKIVIWGNATAGDDTPKKAVYPKKQTEDSRYVKAYSTDDWQAADGAGGRQFAYARTPEALQLARRLFPRVFRAWRLDTQDTEITNALDGFDDRYSDEGKYPKGKFNRQALQSQLQFYLSDLAGGSGTENWLEQKFPVRVEVQNDAGWQDAVYTNITSIGEGVFMLDMAEQYNGKPQCVYSGSLFASGLKTKPDSLNVTLKNVRMNIAFPMDHRVSGYASSSANTNTSETNKDRNLMRLNYLKETGDGGYIQYIDSPIGYREEHQVNSTPTPNAEMYIGGEAESKTTEVPLNRLLPPGSEGENAQQAAARRLYSTQRIDRRSSWKMIGIRPEWTVGVWVDSILLLEQNEAGDALKDSGESKTYPINAPILSVVHDFQQQVTNINGLIGEEV
jgi:hypothetical protein